MPDRDPRVIRRFVLVAVLLPIVIVAVGVVVQLAIAPNLPDPVAVHWSADGQPNGFASAQVATVVMVAVGLGLPLLLALGALAGLRHGGRGPTYRLLGAVALGLAVQLTVLVTWTLLIQVGLADAADCPSVWPAIVGSFVVAVAAGVLGWALQPHEDRPSLGAAAPTTVVLRPGERAVWLRTTSMSRVLVAVVLATMVLLVLATVSTWLAGPTPLAVGMSVLFVVVAILVVGTTAFHVRVDQDGLTVRSILGVPRFRIPLADIAEVRLASVTSIGDFGGYGLRGTPQRFGVILHRGDAISVTRRNGHEFVVTVDDAAGGAALLQALVDRSAAGH